MSALSQFGGGSRSVAAIFNAQSSGGAAVAGIVARGPVRTVASGALTANTLATVLSVTGRGCINVAAAATVDTTARTVRLRVVVDGRVIFDATTNSTGVADSGICAVGFTGNLAGTAVSPVFEPIPFKQSLLVQVASSLTETDKINAYLHYEVDV